MSTRAEFEHAADDIVSSIERRFGFRVDKWGNKKMEAESRFACPVCHCPREEHGCSTSTEFKVEDGRNGTGRRRSRVSLFVFCRHPDTFKAVAAARRYHEIDPSAASVSSTD